MARTILIADDDADNRALVAALLESVGFAVHTVGNGREACARLGAIRPDLILTDLVMPFVDGMQLVRMLKADTALADIPVIAMSASASVYTHEEALHAGCSGFLPKPLKLTALLETIGCHLGLQWRYRSDTSPLAAHEIVMDQPFRLEPKLAAQLLDLALQGDVMGITALIDSALADDSSAVPFCAQLRGLAARYDVRAIRQVLATSSGK